MSKFQIFNDEQIECDSESAHSDIIVCLEDLKRVCRSLDNDGTVWFRDHNEILHWINQNYVERQSGCIDLFCMEPNRGNSEYAATAAHIFRILKPTDTKIRVRNRVSGDGKPIVNLNYLTKYILDRRSLVLYVDEQ